MPRYTFVPAIGIAATALAGGMLAAAQPPRISKPRPAPPSTRTMPPLPPAVIDDTLAV